MTATHHHRAGRLGGSVSAADSTRKAAALRRLHASRRGVRQHGGPRRERETVLADLAAAVREPIRGVRSIRVLAGHLRVDDRTVRRWLAGIDWPSATAISGIRTWLKSLNR